MGAWGPGIFDDDVAMDVRGMFEDALSHGMDVERATASVLSEMGNAVEDMDDGPVIWLALAALQLERGKVMESVRTRVLEIITQGTGLERWEEAGGETLEERKRELDEFRQSLEASVYQ